MIKQKYQSVLDLGTELNIQNGDVSEENGVLKIKGTAKTQYEKNIIWDEIKAVEGQNPSDIKADINSSKNRSGKLTNLDLEMAGLLLFFLVMEEVCTLKSGSHIVLFSDN